MPSLHYDGLTMPPLTPETSMLLGLLEEQLNLLREALKMPPLTHGELIKAVHAHSPHQAGGPPR